MEYFALMIHYDSKMKDKCILYNHWISSIEIEFFRACLFSSTFPSSSTFTDVLISTSVMKKKATNRKITAIAIDMPITAESNSTWLRELNSTLFITIRNTIIPTIIKNVMMREVHIQQFSLRYESISEQDLHLSDSTVLYLITCAHFLQLYLCSLMFLETRCGLPFFTSFIS